MAATFRLPEEQIKDLRRELKTHEKIEPKFSVDVKDEAGTVIAEVQKVRHVRKKRVEGSDRLVIGDEQTTQKLL